MKTKLFYISTLLATTLTFGSCNNSKAETITNPETAVTTLTEKPTAENKIQVAILLDTSGSMNGLIEQAKSRLWNIVNTLTTLKYKGKTPEIEISLYEYGNSGLSSESNYIRQISPLSTDLDLISEKLFSLKTNGGEEYCGAVIQDAVTQLKWKDGNKNMKLVYIAGNEPFNQGSINYKDAVKNALNNDIYVNTIFCGNNEEGIRTFWQDGAITGNGKYFNIDSNQRVQYINTPYDDQITKCNERINTTYISYGRKGAEKKMNQATQDANAESVSKANYVERSVSKSKQVYKNDSWDLVDKISENEEALDDIAKEELPSELKDKNKAEIKVYVAQKSAEREKIQKEISVLAKKRQEYIDNEMKKQKTQDDLGNAIASSIVALGKNKGYTVEK
ncbi:MULTISPECIES: vWA domain-containing protein [Flavobacterium]|uniref:VWA domain-containing protein n=1 Tax=Flavobacterium jumunjinense TaxID=998845 RepID=A0ABV5GPR0_9FLAO|nr:MULTISPECIES: vWA domain-containing protein [Flavobacterium]